jgi:hypothetical protein
MHRRRRVWGPIGKAKEQLGLIITPHDQPQITTDDLDAAQLVYLLFNRATFRFDRSESRDITETVKTSESALKALRCCRHSLDPMPDR